LYELLTWSFVLTLQMNPSLGADQVHRSLAHGFSLNPASQKADDALQRD
jgi:hypothetical protein